jgi:hypothetical protein
MKKMLLTLTFLVLLCGFSFGQKDLDVIHFKNGAVVKGRIIENVINNYVKIELLDGSVVAYSYSDIDKITKEVTTPQRKTSGETNQQKQMLYETQKKNPGTAVVFSCLLTSAGHAYAGNWGRGLLFTAARVGCAVFAVTAGIEEKEYNDYGYYYTETEITSAYYIGMSGALIFAIWEMFDAHKEVERYNRKLYNRIYSNQPGFGLNIVPAKRGAKMTLSYAF